MSDTCEQIKRLGLLIADQDLECAEIGLGLDAEVLGRAGVHVEVDDEHLPPTLREGASKLHRNRGLSDPSLLIEQRDDGHSNEPAAAEENRLGKSFHGGQASGSLCN